MARIATEIMMAKATGTSYDMGKLVNKKPPHYGVKEAVLPFNMFPEVDPVLGPEMRSTGEVLGMAESFELAFFKAEEATSIPLPTSGTVLISVNDKDKDDALEAAKIFAVIGFKIMATKGTCSYLSDHGVACEEIKKLFEGRPNAITNREINLIINTPCSKASEVDDSYIRKLAIKSKVPYITTMTAALASANGIKEYIRHAEGESTLKSLQEYHADIMK
jgi:carbamoyl-phosphate synthase large subunit